MKKSSDDDEKVKTDSTYQSSLFVPDEASYNELEVWFNYVVTGQNDQ